MSDFDPESLEQELSKLRPGKPPPDFIQRISAGVPCAPRPRRRLFSSWWGGLGWATAAAAIVIVLGLVHQAPRRTPARDQAQLAQKPAGESLKADNVEINQQLIGSFDAVAQLSDGQPVRLRCREWRDAVVLRDSARGVIIERQGPRLEVIPVRFETY